ncbi:MAG TPA: sodium-translocating pyrophosphatase [Candidatus Diapherotrites archaeon]|uniref:K(+)-insensitive pyrophosphate-energized proton pump n=1 Tax=Candidatus Iainarchaeum sp. TaxID=3101447 RepID=A0A7J4IUC7_9ARCH|nr:sodium-translocating pyrophosphatase [Candidatus Diapherotrites archaeon]
MLEFIFAVGIISILCALGFAWWVLKQDAGSVQMQTIAGYIREGAEAYIKRQYTSIALLAGVTALIILGVYAFVGKWDYAVQTSVAFILGAFCSAVAGIIGMFISVRANIRTAAAATTSSPKALKVALYGGAVTGIFVVALSLLGVTTVFYAFGADPLKTPFIIVGYAFGASFVALFAQLGGGIFTKAADIGADLVGKIEAGIPEDDPRNPAVVADLVGDNVGDCAGRGADIFESTAAETIGAMILGVALFSAFGANGVLFPLVATALGLIASIIGLLFVKAGEEEDPMRALDRGYYIACIVATVLFYFATTILLGSIWFFAAALVGIVMSILFVYITQYYTEYRFRPVRSIAKASQTGHATNIITGLAVALENTALPVIVICISLYISFNFGLRSGVANGGLFGTAVATMGMLATAAYILAMDAFGPITDNAGGIVEMSKAPANVRRNTDRLDAAGNTTKALTKGYAIGSAALAAFLLFSAYMDEVARLTGQAFTVVNLAKIDVFIGAMLGAMLIFLFSAFAISAVGNTAGYIIEEVRRQFRDKDILSGKVKPDYAKCVDITTAGALRNMVLPGLVAVGFPIVVGVLLKSEAMAAFLMVGTISGILMAILMNNGGGAWDNAKKYIETGAHGGKGSDAHKAAVVGDTVGDPLKDTAGPSIHVLIKLLATISLVLAPLFL